MRSRICTSAAVCALTILTACGMPGPAVSPSLELAAAPADLAVSRKGDVVTVSWTPPAHTVDRQNVRLKKLGPTVICRGVNEFPMAKCSQVVGQAKPVPPLPPPPGKKKSQFPPRTSYNDALPADLQQMYPTGFATYAVEVMNWRWRSAGLSNQLKVSLAPVLAPPKAPQATVTQNGIAVAFDCTKPSSTASGLQFECRLYRQEADGAGTTVIQNIPMDGRPCDPPEKTGFMCGIVDRGTEWEKTYSYFVTMATDVTQGGKKTAEVEGDNSPATSIFAKDVFPPEAPVGLQAVASGVGQKPFIDLAWTPNTEPDLAGYNIYRRGQDSADWVKLNTELVILPTYRDEKIAPGQSYTYSLTAVDLRGNESAHSEPATETAT
jgi:hypothetical protein